MEVEEEHFDPLGHRPVTVDELLWAAQETLRNKSRPDAKPRRTRTKLDTDGDDDGGDTDPEEAPVDRVEAASDQASVPLSEMRKKKPLDNSVNTNSTSNDYEFLDDLL
eukprot:Clim_evm58s109 gene=Clim_evmTU58s109